MPMCLGTAAKRPARSSKKGRTRDIFCPVAVSRALHTRKDPRKGTETFCKGEEGRPDVRRVSEEALGRRGHDDNRRSITLPMRRLRLTKSLRPAHTPLTVARVSCSCFLPHALQRTRKSWALLID